MNKFYVVALLLMVSSVEFVFASNTGKLHKNTSVRRDLKKGSFAGYGTSDYVSSVTNQSQDFYKKEDTSRGGRGAKADRIASDRKRSKNV